MKNVRMVVLCCVLVLSLVIFGCKKKAVENQAEQPAGGTAAVEDINE